MGVTIGRKHVGIRVARGDATVRPTIWEIHDVPRDWTDELVLKLVTQQTELSGATVVRRQTRCKSVTWWLTTNSRYARSRPSSTTTKAVTS